MLLGNPANLGVEEKVKDDEFVCPLLKPWVPPNFDIDWNVFVVFMFEAAPNDAIVGSTPQFLFIIPIADGIVLISVVIKFKTNRNSTI